MRSPQVQQSKDRTDGGSSDIVVFKIRNDSKCAECGHELFGGDLLRADYDEQLMLHGDRSLARMDVREQIDRVVAKWQGIS